MLGNRPLSVPDEGRYVEIPREMVLTGDYITPRLNGVKYLEKPVLFYWLESFSIRLFGLREYTLRLWPAIFALFGCLAVYTAGKRLYGRRAGLIAAVVLATSVLYYAMSRVIVLDMAVSVLITAALLSFIAGTHEPQGLRRRLLMWSFYAFCALAVLVKGLIGIVIPGMVICAWIILLGEWRVLGSMYLVSGMGLFLLIAAPWHILVARQNPEFFNFYFIHEHFLRYLTKIHGRYEPPWFFVPVFLLGLFPWTAFLVQAVKFGTPSSWSERHEHRDALFLLVWAALVFLFFSASDSKLIPYILPVFPPLAILIGRYLSEAWKSGNVPGLAPGYIMLGLFSILLAVALNLTPHYRTELDARGLHRFFDLLSLVVFAGTLLTWALARWKSFKWALSAMAVSMVVFLLVFDSAGHLLDTRSIKHLALELKTRLKPSDEVVNYKTYYQDLPVYLERRITLVDWTGELAFGTTVEDTSAWMIDDAAFWKRWYGTKTMYMFTKRGTFEALRSEGRRRLYFVAGTNEAVLIANKEIKS